jgi:hypothetical protein
MSNDRSDSAVEAGGTSAKPRGSIPAAEDICDKGIPIGASGDARGVISSGRFRFSAIDCVTRLVSARGRADSAGLAVPELGPGRPRDPRREPPERAFPAPGVGAAGPAVGRAARESGSRITRPSLAVKPRGGAGRVVEVTSFQRGGEVRSGAVAGLRSASALGRVEFIDPPGLAVAPDRAGPPRLAVAPDRAPPGPGPRACRTGNGWASRLKSEVRAQSAMIDSNTIN